MDSSMWDIIFIRMHRLCFEVILLLLLRKYAVHPLGGMEVKLYLQLVSCREMKAGLCFLITSCSPLKLLMQPV